MATPTSPSSHRRISSPSFSPPPPSSTPLFFSPNPRPKPSAPLTSPATSTTPIPTPRRRTPLSATTASSASSDRKRSPAAMRSWNRRLSFSSTSSPVASGSGTPLTQGGQGGGGGAVFNFSSPGRKDPFDLSGLAMDVDGIAEQRGGTVTPRTAERRMKRLPTGSAWQRRKGSKTRINDLPDEILLRIFGFLNETLGFRPLSSRVSVTPEWYNPPMRIALVCKRWLPLARHIFYRFLKISHLSRIPLLYHTFTTTDLSLLVRHLSIDLPPSAVDQLGKPWHVASSSTATAGTTREADSDLDSLASGQTTPIEGSAVQGGGRGARTDNSVYPLTPSRKKPRKPLLPQDQLRAVFQSCSELLSLEISGVPPALLFTSSYSSASSSSTSRPGSPALPSSASPLPPSPSALHHLHLLRLSTVTSLTLRAGPSYSHEGTEGHITSTTLRDALLALTGLTSLTLKGYVSSSRPEEALDFAPTRTAQGLLARPLPSRARARALLPLRSLKLVDCAMSPSDLLTLLKQLRQGSLRDLTVEEAFNPALARKRERVGLWGKPTVEGLNQRGLRKLFRERQAGMTGLRVTLHNYPVVVGGAAVTSPAMAAAVATSPPRRRRTVPLPSTNTANDPRTDTDDVPEEGDLHLLDSFISSCLPALTSLDLGGLVVTPQLFSPPPLPAPPGSPSSLLPTPPSLPSTVKRLTLRSCPSITPSVLSSFLLSLPASWGALSSLTIHGSTEYGWASPTACWDVQRACWERGVRWSSGRQGGGVVWTGVAPSPSFSASSSSSSAASATASGSVTPASVGGHTPAVGLVLGEGTGGDDLVDLASSSAAETREGAGETTTITTTASMMDAVRQQEWVGQGWRLGRAEGRW